MLTVENLSCRYKGGPMILNQVSFSVEDGRFLAILGNNGVGKSTMLKCFNRIMTPDGGTIRMDGDDLSRLSSRDLAQRIAFVEQNVPSTQLTVHDIVMLGLTEADHRIVHEAMDRLGISHLRGRFLSRLSGGERQKVMLARALAQQPKLLLLDEPTSSLDIQNQYQVLQIVQDICGRDGITAAVVIHDLNLALRFCDQILLLRQGTVYRCGGPEVLDRQALKDVYKIDAGVVSVKGRSMVVVD